MSGEGFHPTLPPRVGEFVKRPRRNGMTPNPHKIAHCKTTLDIVKCSFTIGEAVIESFRHKGLRRLFEENKAAGVNPEHVRKIRQVLAVLEEAETIQALDLPTFRLHALKGDLRNFWAVTVRANLRIVFRFEDGRAWDVDLVDYH
ncbi:MULTISPECIES: type II toxin-antitoxin system RelE/ParE family toxin [unclassified Bradyrhizobium]|uniref:type II toxin-antitoxin system RelE/ParE family toxin n=1 Tax=unclassified Bradyrhizobium TaxID=2631580 RepID=UPI0028EDC5D0|nr:MULTISPECIES: type II toxin-antitoxin system RelE/ParE family toxin [unclassified Bradyrhizobium]